MDNNELLHWGIKGMKWGVRRYQNKDGTLTAAGKKRYKAEMDKLKAEEAALKNRAATKAKLAKLDTKRKSIDALKKSVDGASEPKHADQSRKKSIGDMSDDELIKAVRRAQLEDQYKTLRPETVSTGRKFAGKILNEAIVPASINAGRRFLENSMNKFGDTLLKDKAIVDPDSVSELEKTAKKLELKNKINKLSKGESDMSWDDRIKQQTYEKNLADKILDDLVRANKITEAKRTQAELQKLGQDIVDELLDELKDK